MRAERTNAHKAGQFNLITWIQLAFAVAAVVLIVFAVNMAWGDIPRLSDGKPDLSGYYDTGTITPMQRGGSGEEFLSAEQAERNAAGRELWQARELEGSDPNREAPPVGGDGSGGAAGNVGGYNAFWIDPGESNFEIDGKYPTSIIIDPPNGRFPAITEAARERRRSAFRLGGDYGRRNTGTAWWYPGPGPYDDPEIRPFPDRCLSGFGSTAGPPMLSTLYNNHKRIVQTPGHVMILTEMVHDARIVRMNGEHAPDDVRRWFGDSIGWWEDDTLVVETTNFTDRPNFSQGTRDMRVVERFSRVDGDILLYNFTVEDPNVWETSFTGQYTWRQTDEPVYEYACHEGNYSMEGILGGARRMEREAMAEAMAKAAADSGD
ncbi:MAG: hypothetical protein OXH68_01935 [Gammaproteobacteria bacterium]|nr:hypothetical protein [Gammaproteobacteria bacterium]